jgi:hypothetical protein
MWFLLFTWNVLVYGCIGAAQVPIITNNDEHSRDIIPISSFIHAGLRTSWVL